MLRRLAKEYPEAGTRLLHGNAFQLLVATILSAQSTDAQVNRVTKKLFREYRTPAEFARADLRELKKIVRSAGYYNQKARRIKESAKIISGKYRGRVPRSMHELVQLPGVGRKTANIVLSYGFGKDEGIAVDTHVFRLSRRLGLSSANTAEKVEKDLMELLPRKKWGTVNSILIFHGRAVCTARNPKHGECVLFELCPSRGI